jgi:hypothetical protein
MASKNGPFLEALLGTNFFVTMHTIFKKYPLLAPVQFLFIPPSALINEFRARKLNRKELERRIEHRGKTKHLDHFDQLLPVEAPEPTRKEKSHIEAVCGQLFIAGYAPVESQFLCTIMFSLQQSESHRRLLKEIRDAFKRYEDITPEALASLSFLHASLMETS